MSAWYILNSMGFYQVCPGKPVYSIGRPAFDKAVINLPGGKTFSIIAKNNSKKNKYIESISLNGKSLENSILQPSGYSKRRKMEIRMTDQA
jgi:putative alpha-1,2-mannosidase